MSAVLCFNHSLSVFARSRLCEGIECVLSCALVTRCLCLPGLGCVRVQSVCCPVL